MLRDNVKNFFTLSGGNGGLTEEFIYNNQARNPENKAIVYSSSTIEETTMKSISKKCKIIRENKEHVLKSYSGEGLIIARNGKAGTIQYVNNSFTTMNDHAYFLKVKPKYKDNINIRYLEFEKKKLISECVTSDKAGNRTFGKNLFEHKIISIPPIEEQNEIVSEYIKFENMYKKSSEIYSNITSILLKKPDITHGEYKNIEEVFDLISEDRELTEEYVYTNQGDFPVYSAQISGPFGYINKASFKGELITVVQYGNSGKVFYRSGEFSIGRNNCGLVPKDEWKDKTNLRFMKYALEQAFILNSKGDGLKSLSQNTINKTRILVPDIKEQNLIAKEYEELEIIHSDIGEIIKEIVRIIY